LILDADSYFRNNNNKKKHKCDVCLYHFCLLVWLNWIVGGQQEMP